MKSGYVAIIGPPNAGKSTLLNAILGEKIAIVTPKPQTTRSRLLGIHSTEEYQMIFLDTPGLHHIDKPLNKYMEGEINEAIRDADIVLFLFDSTKRDQFFGRFADGFMSKHSSKKYIIGVNKIDLSPSPPPPPIPSTSLRAGKGGGNSILFPSPLPPSSRLRRTSVGEEPVLSLSKDRGEGNIRISALTGEGVPELVEKIKSLLPEGPAYYPTDDLTDKDLRYLTSEIIREKVIEATYQEVPYSTAIEIISFTEGEKLCRIVAHVIVEQESQKGIVIGAKAQMIKKIGTSARIDIEKWVGTKVHLDLRVKVDKNWTKNRTKLAKYGYFQHRDPTKTS